MDGSASGPESGDTTGSAAAASNVDDTFGGSSSVPLIQEQQLPPSIYQILFHTNDHRDAGYNEKTIWKSEIKIDQSISDMSDIRFTM